jgi:tricarballylate dehydrogenase
VSGNGAVHVHDVIVIGGGNAGLSAALTARETVEDVVVLEKAPEARRGGNSFFTGGRMRVPHAGLEDLAELFDVPLDEVSDVEVEPYPENDFYYDMQRASLFRADDELTRLIASRARDGVDWLKDLGAKFYFPFGYDDIKNNGKRKLVGHDDIEHYEGGPGLVANLIRNATERGIAVHYETGARKLIRTVDGVVGVVVDTPEGERELRARSIILACGGFEASPTMRAAYLGPGWDLAKVRGTEYNTGDGLTMALEIGARAYGHFAGCHSVAADYFAPDFGMREHGDITERVSYHYGITVNRHAKRYFDESAELRAFTYAVSGRNLIEQAEGFGVQIFDSQTIDLLRATYRSFNVTMSSSDDLREVARETNLDPDTLVETIAQYNKAVQEGALDYTVLDGKKTKGIEPPKSNWALRIDKPPYYAFPVGPAITFTFGGLRVNTSGEVLDQGDHTIPGLYAAGEMVGGIYYHNYPGGSGLTSGLVMGREAGKTAAARAQSLSVVPAHAG